MTECSRQALSATGVNFSVYDKRVDASEWIELRRQAAPHDDEILRGTDAAHAYIYLCPYVYT